MNFSIKGNLVDIQNKRIYPAEITIRKDRIAAIQKLPSSFLEDFKGTFILPGFIDAHVHIESSMLVPSEFARLAVVHGTVATLSDPHEIANVCGRPGINYMIENGNSVPFKFYFGAPSCVPATVFETAGATITAEDIEELMQRDEIHYLSEMMNFPGVLNNDPDIFKKINAAKRFDKPIDGHAPGLRGEAAQQYIHAGISTDHECFTKEEALDKLKYGMKIIIREGSAAKNFEVLVDLLNEYPDYMMFCSDDKHPDSLVEGHMNVLCTRAVAKGIDVFKVLQAACVNPVNHYKLKVGLLRQNDFADFIVVKDLRSFEVRQTYINGELVAEDGKSRIKSKNIKAINHFNCPVKKITDFRWDSSSASGFSLPIIEALEGQLITNKLFLQPKIVDGRWESDIENDLLKIVVVNRYKSAPVAKAFIKNFGLKRGAIASSVAHDSHNIIAVGVDDESLYKAVNWIIEQGGGISCCDSTSSFPERKEAVITQDQPNQEANNNSGTSKSRTSTLVSSPDGRGREGASVLPLPVAGIMSAEDGYEVARQYAALDAAAKTLGCTLAAPFMTLSFMALLVIPHLKLSDKGLFDGDAFTLINPVAP